MDGGQQHTYAHFFRFLLSRFGGDFGCFEGKGGEIVRCGHDEMCWNMYLLRLSVAMMLRLVNGWRLDMD